MPEPHEHLSAAELDRRYVWHPFTPIDDWLHPLFEPVVIASGRGAELTATDGRTYLDGNSSIWTNIHGHRHPVIDAAIRQQLTRIAHCSALGLANEPAARLAARLCERLLPDRYRAFFSDDGSTAVEAAVKMAFQYFQQNGQPCRTRFISLEGAYHGDTVGAMSVGQSGAFHGVFRPLMFETLRAPAPGCYRCPCNRSTPPETRDARDTSACSLGARLAPCMEPLERLFSHHGPTIAALIMEPRVQGPAGMVMHPPGYLRRAADLAKAHGAFLILDEVMTGLGRTGAFFACDHENVRPDFLCLAKGLTGGYLPFAATLAREEIFSGFRGDVARTFFHGHSYCGNPLGAAAALACLEVFDQEKTLERVQNRAATLRHLAQRFWEDPRVGDVRQEGLILAVELVEDRPNRRPMDIRLRVAWRISERARRFGLLTRGIGNVLILMPPLCVTDEQLEAMTAALFAALQEEPVGFSSSSIYLQG
jgi:adenosylmethionine-8-amino-7-oxononanoate aminotransferase